MVWRIHRFHADMNLSVLSGIFPDVRINTIQFFMTFSIFFRVLHDIFRDSMQGKSHVYISFPSYFYCWFNPPFYNRIHYSSVRVCQPRCAVSLIAAIKTLDFCTILFFGNCQSLKPAINIFFCVIEHIKFIIITCLYACISQIFDERKPCFWFYPSL